MLNITTQIELLNSNPNDESKELLTQLLKILPETTTPLVIVLVKRFIRSMIKPFATITEDQKEPPVFTETKDIKPVKYIIDHVGYTLEELEAHQKNTSVVQWTKGIGETAKSNRAIASEAYLICSSAEKERLAPPFETVVAHVITNPLDYYSHENQKFNENAFREAFYRDLHILFKSLQSKKVENVILAGIGTSTTLETEQLQWFWQAAYDLLSQNPYGFKRIFFSAPSVDGRDVYTDLQNFLAKCFNADKAKETAPDIFVTNVEIDVLAFALHSIDRKMTLGLAECTAAPTLCKKVDVLTTALIAQNPELNPGINKLEPRLVHAGVTQLVENKIKTFYPCIPVQTNVYVGVPENLQSPLPIYFKDKDGYGAKAFAKTFKNVNITPKPSQGDAFENPLGEKFKQVVKLPFDAAYDMIHDRLYLPDIYINLLFDPEDKHQPPARPQYPQGGLPPIPPHSSKQQTPINPGIANAATFSQRATQHNQMPAEETTTTDSPETLVVTAPPSDQPTPTPNL